MRHLLHLRVVRFQKQLMRPREISFNLLVLAVLGDDFLELGVLLRDLLQPRRVAHHFRRRKLLRHLLVPQIELVQFFSQCKYGHGETSVFSHQF